MGDQPFGFGPRVRCPSISPSSLPIDSSTAKRDNSTLRSALCCARPCRPTAVHLTLGLVFDGRGLALDASALGHGRALPTLDASAESDEGF